MKEDGYDFVFLDCPPSLGLLTVNALAAAEELIVPIQCEYYALEGLGQLLHNVRLVQQNINPILRLTGIVMTMFDSRTKLSEQVVDEVKRYFEDRVYDVIIPRTVRISEAPGFGQPITVYDPKSRGAEAYRALAREVLEKPQPEGEAMPVMEDMPRVILPPEEIAPPGPPRPTPSRSNRARGGVRFRAQRAAHRGAGSSRDVPPGICGRRGPRCRFRSDKQDGRAAAAPSTKTATHRRDRDEGRHKDAAHFLPDAGFGEWRRPKASYDEVIQSASKSADAGTERGPLRQAAR